MNSRASKLRVERAAVAAAELSLSRCAELYAAVPVVDHGTDLLVYQVEPFRVAKLQIKGATRGLRVFWQYAQNPMIVAYVLDPLGAAEVVLFSGEQAWNLPLDYVARGGRASDHDHDGHGHYTWKARTGLLNTILDQCGSCCSTRPLRPDRGVAQPGGHHASRAARSVTRGRGVGRAR